MNVKDTIRIAFESCSAALNMIDVIRDNHDENEEGFTKPTNSETLVLLEVCNILRVTVQNLPSEALNHFEPLRDTVGDCYPHLYENPDDDSEMSLDGLSKRLYVMHTSLSQAQRLAEAMA